MEIKLGNVELSRSNNIVHRETKNVLGIKLNSWGWSFCYLNSFHVMLPLL